MTEIQILILEVFIITGIWFGGSIILGVILNYMMVKKQKHV
jgi:hypothetical protein